MQGLENYWREGFPKVEGWVDERLLPFLKLVDDTQRSAGIVGEMGEIGVFHGKFLIALAHLADIGSKVTAIDVFEDQSKNLDGAGVGSLERLQENIRNFAPSQMNYAFIKADSIALNSVDKTDFVRNYGPFRIFSVDGCHTSEHTCTDLLTAQDSLALGGVVILDDFMQPHWPGVTEAVNMFHSRYVPRVRPFLYCCHKLFFIGHGWHASFFNTFASHFGDQGNMKVCDMFGSRVLVLYP